MQKMSNTLSSELASPSVVIPVSLLNRLAREAIERAFPLCWVGGEVSNLTFAASGHVYFSLKDENAQVRCVMYRPRAQLLGWRLENGQRVEVRARATLYEARGEFQLVVDSARKTGKGNLYEQFMKLREKLDREGLFSREVKRELPKFPRRVGIVTSTQAAVLRDVLATLSRRAPHVDVIIYPTPVQGADAPDALRAALALAGTRNECDLLILCRGGGSLEDLWAFNDEKLARAIRACPLPVISAVGHETDFTIADFVADRRAPTPTAAAELAAPERSTSMRFLVERCLSLERRIRHVFEQKSQRLDALEMRLRSPAQEVERRREALSNLERRFGAAFGTVCTRGKSALAGLASRLIQARPGVECSGRRIDTLTLRLRSASEKKLNRATTHLVQLENALSHLDPNKVLARGYSIVFNKKGTIVRDSHQLEAGASITLSFHKGAAGATVVSTAHEKPACAG
jgi:exodeoxyribonuclease VII large subunit